MSEENKERHFRRSDSIAKLAEALALAQGQVGGAAKSAANPFFKSKYADLASVIEAIKEPFSKNGLAYMQFARANGDGVEVETLMAHASGEWVADAIFIPCQKYDAQGIGSAITYGKRYGLQAIAGVPSEDDDGNAAAASQGKAKDAIGRTLLAAADKGSSSLKTIWESLTVEQRKMFQCDLPKLKDAAAAHDAKNQRQPGDE